MKSDVIAVDRRKTATTALQELTFAINPLKSNSQGAVIKETGSELTALQQPESTHSEYGRQLQAVSDRRDIKIKQEMKLHQYKKQALKNSTLAERSQLLSQYLQDAREIREQFLYDLGKQWYDIQKERRAAQSDELEQYGVPFPTKRSEQVRQQAKYNTEVSVLAGVAKHVGFPAAPDIGGTRSKELEDDLKAMKVRAPCVR